MGGNPKSPLSFGRFDTWGSLVALFVPEIGGGTLGVTEKEEEEEEEEKDWSCSILVIGLSRDCLHTFHCCLRIHYHAFCGTHSALFV